MSEKIIFATGNVGKLKEIREILKDLNREIVTMREAGFEGEIEENGTTFRENAEIKAKAVWEKTGGIVLADDSGLVIDYLNGEPGVYSARYLGDTPYEEKNRILIERVKDGFPTYNFRFPWKDRPVPRFSPNTIVFSSSGRSL